MRRRKRIAYILLAISMLSVSVLSPMKANAGFSQNVLNSSMLDDSNWSNPEEDVYVEEGTIVFPETSTEYSRYITRTPVRLDKSFANLVKLSSSITFSQFPSGKNFVIAFGLSSIEGIVGEAKNVEVTFHNEGGIKVGVTAYDESGTAVVVASPKSCSMSLNREAKIDIAITTDSKITVAVNGSNVCSGTLPVSGEGRVGFMQTGEVAADIKNLELVHYKYDRPENTNVFEDFEKGTMDVSKLTAKAVSVRSYFPRGQIVEEYNGSQVMMFRNIAQAYIGTLYQYSNFEMTFDVPYILTESIYDEEGNLQTPGQNSFTVAIGNEQADWDTWGWESAQEAIVFDKNAIYSQNHQEEVKYEYKENEKNYLTDHNGGCSIKIHVFDSTVTVGMKWMNEDTYKTVLAYELSTGTPYGYIQIWSTETGHFAVDNLKIENLDDNPNLIETEYKSGKWEEAQDVQYEPMKRVYSDNAQSQGNMFSWYLLIPITATIGLVTMATVAVVVHVKSKKKEAKVNEE